MCREAPHLCPLTGIKRSQEYSSLCWSNPNAPGFQQKIHSGQQQGPLLTPNPQSPGETEPQKLMSTSESREGALPEHAGLASHHIHLPASTAAESDCKRSADYPFRGWASQPGENDDQILEPFLILHIIKQWQGRAQRCPSQRRRWRKKTANAD